MGKLNSEKEEAFYSLCNLDLKNVQKKQENGSSVFYGIINLIFVCFRAFRGSKNNSVNKRKEKKKWPLKYLNIEDGLSVEYPC